jgi:hypothetical protein
MNKNHWEELLNRIGELDYSKEEEAPVKFTFNVPKSLDKIVTEHIRMMEDEGIKVDKTRLYIALISQGLFTSNIVNKVEGKLAETYFKKTKKTKPEHMAMEDYLKDHYTKPKKRKGKKK